MIAKDIVWCSLLIFKHCIALIRNTFLEGTSKTRCPFISGTTLSRILFLAIDWKQSFNLIRKDIFGGAINPWQRCKYLLVCKYTTLKTIDGLLANLLWRTVRWIISYGALALLFLPCIYYYPVSLCPYEPMWSEYALKKLS